VAERGDTAAAQYAFAAHIRDPERSPAPAVEDRRMAIYRDLFFNNIESLLAANFPVIRRILPEAAWRGLVRDFLRRHRCATPLFHEIGQELIAYLRDEREAGGSDPPFLLELAHYEWVELALAVSDADAAVPPLEPDGDLLEGVPVVSPLAWNLTYRFPVHRLGPGFQPTEPGPSPTHLVVYRDRHDRVGFLEINPVTHRFLHLLHGNLGWRGVDALRQVAIELQHPEPDLVVETGRQLIEELRARDILLGTRS
jgi:hypothetical protein